MTKPPAFQFYPSDFTQGTASMDHFTVGVYIRLLCQLWTHGGPLPIENLDHMVDQISTPRQQKILLAKFEIDTDHFSNARLEKTRTDKTAFNDKQRANIQKRWDKLHSKVIPPNESGNTSVVPEPYSSSSSSSSSLKASISKAPKEKTTGEKQGQEGGCKGETKDEKLKAAEHRFEEFWIIYPPRNGKKLNKGKAKSIFMSFTVEQQQIVGIGAMNYAKSELVKIGIGIKDPNRFLRDGGGYFYWKDWQEPEVVTLPKKPETKEDRIQQTFQNVKDSLDKGDKNG